ncbi:MAG: PAS domain-containing protein [Natronospirillum sp.]
MHSLLALACVTLAMLDWRERETGWQRELDTLSGLHQSSISGSVQDVKTLTETAVRLLAANPDVVDSLRIASAIVAAEADGSDNPYSSQLREQIRLELASYWDVLQASGVNMLYLYVSPRATAFLRMHRPYSFGDDVTAVRPMISAAFTTGLTQTGLEEGSASLNYRSALPVSADDNPSSPIVAVLEVGHPALGTERGSDFDKVHFATLYHGATSSLGAADSWPASVQEWLDERRQSPDVEGQQKVFEEDSHAWLLTTVPAYDYRGAGVAVPYATYLALQEITSGYRSYQVGLFKVFGRWVAIYVATSFLLGLVLWLTYRLAFAQQQVHEHEMTAVQRLAHLGHWELDLKTGHTVWSDVMYEIYGRDKQTFKPSLGTYAASLHPDDVEAVKQHGKEAEAGRDFDIEHRIVLPDGTVRWVHEFARFNLDAHNVPVRMIGTTQDITERKRLDQLQRDFVSTVSHELRTPLTSISGALSLLVSGSLKDHPDQQATMLAIAQQNSRRLLHLINDLLDIDKLVAGKLAFEVEAIPLHKLLQASVENIHQYARQHGVEIRCQPIEAGINVLADRQRFEQIMANLLSNAAKFSGADTQIDVAVSVTDGLVRIAVKDQGPGIPEAAKGQIFSRFFQVDGSDARPQGGTGLGLAISRELAEKMGGSLSFESTPGEGATFYLDLPTASAR